MIWVLSIALVLFAVLVGVALSILDRIDDAKEHLGRISHTLDIAVSNKTEGGSR